MQNQIDARKYVAPGTARHAAIGWIILGVFGPLIILVTTASTMGIALLGWLIAGLTWWTRAKRARAQLRGSALQVGPQQFPEIDRAVQEYSARLGLAVPPEVFIAEDNQQNAFALKQGGLHFVVLVDDLVFGAAAANNPKVLDFIIAHELAHHALGHTNLLRSTIRTFYKPISRLDEFSCDAVANALVADPEAAQAALTLLLVGPQLYAKVNREALEYQARVVQADKYSKKSEITLSHPLLLRRYNAIAQSPPVR